MFSFQVRVLQNTAQGKENLPQLRKNAHSLYFHIIITILDLNTLFSLPWDIFYSYWPYNKSLFICCFFSFFFLVQHTQFHVSYSMHLTSIKRSKRVRKCFPNAGRSWINLKTSNLRWTAADEIPVLRNFCFRSQCQVNLL